MSMMRCLMSISLPDNSLRWKNLEENVNMDSIAYLKKNSTSQRYNLHEAFTFMVSFEIKIK